MSSNNIARLIVGFIFFVVLLVSGRNYLQYKTVMERDKPVKYALVKTYHKSSKGRPSYMDVVFQGRIYSVEITARIEKNIGKNIYPAVYYMEREDSLFIEWDATFSLGLLIMWFVFVLGFWVPLVSSIRRGI